MKLVTIFSILWMMQSTLLLLVVSLFFHGEIFYFLLFENGEKVEFNNKKVFAPLPGFAEMEADRTSEVSKIRFGVREIPSSCIEQRNRCFSPLLSNELKLPPQNEFLASGFTVYLPVIQNYSERVGLIQKVSSSHGVIYIGKDSEYANTFHSSLVKLLSPVCYP